MGLDVRVHVLDSNLNMKVENFTDCIQDYNTRWSFYPSNLESLLEDKQLNCFDSDSTCGVSDKSYDDLINFIQPLLKSSGMNWWSIANVGAFRSLSDVDTSWFEALSDEDFLLVLGDQYE